MKIFTRTLTFLLVIAALLCERVSAQSILNPTDSVYTYNASAKAGTPTNPNGPAAGTIGKWIRTVRMSWNTNMWKAYILNGIPFRLIYPTDYNPTANDGKKYPMLIFFHGAGEIGPATDNEESLANGGQFFTSSVQTNTFDGYILIQQAPANGWDNSWLTDAKDICDYMITNNKLDPYRISTNGLSAGGEGSWAMTLLWPNYIAANLPMSAINLGEGTTANINIFKFTRIWDFQGGLDTSPDPNTAGEVSSDIWAAGGNYKYTLYPTLGHGTWNTVWAEPNFWPFIDSSYMSNPWTLFGQTAFCPGVPVNVTIGVTPNMDAYQWRMNGTVISGATTNTINATQYGTYDCRIERNSIWSDWSHVPVVIGIKQPTVTPPITVSGIMSDAIPDGSGLPYVNLQVPNNGYSSYTWEKVGSSTVVDTTRIFKVSTPGQYIVSVTQPLGCSSIFSPAFTVINAAGPNPPSPANGLLATSLGFTKAQLNWTRNANPSHPEVAFEVYRGNTKGGPYTYVGQARADSVQYIDSNLTANTKYYYVVRAIDSTAAAPLSNEASVLTQSDKQPPTAPANLVLVSTTSNSAALKWNQSTDNVGVVNYFIYVNGVKSYINPVGDTTFMVYELVPNQVYTFAVAAVDAAGNISNHSNQVSGASVNNGLVYNYYTTATAWSVLPNFSTLTAVSSGVMPNVSIANATQTTNFGYTWSGTIKIPVAGTYTFATTSDDGSAMWFNQTSATGTPLVNNDGAHGSTQKTGTVTLTPGSYPIFVEYFQAGGGSAMSLTWACPQLYGNSTQVAIPNQYFASSFTEPGTPPARPTVITATPVSYKQVNVTWVDNSNNETGFEVYRSTSLNSVFSILGTTAPNVTSFADSTAQPSTTYFYKVQAIDTYGGSGFDSLSTGGVAYGYYTFNGSWTTMPNFNTLTPVFTGNESNFSLSPATATTDFAFKFTGYINIPTQGTYTFYTSSDDGSDLYIGGYDSAHLVVKNDFLQGQTQRSGTVVLSPGRYPIIVTYFQETGGYALTTSYAGPGISMRLIPDSALYNKASIATTFALPTVPAAPSGLNLVPTSSKVTLGWTNNATNATAVQVYRSSADSVHYVLVATLASTATNYADTGLFANAIYYYKLNATNPGGNSAFTPAKAVTTKDVVPVITPLGTQSAHYGTTTTIAVTANSVNSGTLVLSALNLPSFASFTDNGNRTGTLTVTPTAANLGLYNGLAIVATDALGGSDTSGFSLSVNNNYAPTVNSIANVTMNENDTLSIPLVATDVNSGDTITLAVSSLPNAFTVTQVSNGVATLFLHPSFAAAGTYNVVVTANDRNGLSGTGTFVLKVNYKDPTTKIYTRFFAGDTVGKPWNTINGPVSTNFVDANGNATTLGLTINTSWYNANSDGPYTGNNSGIYPDAVLKDNYWFSLYGSPSVINATLTGMDSTQTYNLTFFSSSGWLGGPNNGTTTFTVGNVTQSLAVQQNEQNTVTFTGIKPTGTTIPFAAGVLPNSNGGYINAIVITKNYDDGTAPVAPINLTATLVPGTGNTLNWTDVAYNAASNLVYRSVGDSLHFLLLATLPATSTTYTDSVATGNSLNYYRMGADNAHGYSGFSNVVSVLTPDRVPQITAIADVVVPNNQTMQVNVTAVDDPTDHLTLTATGLPSFASFTDNGNGTGVVNIQPTAGLQGSFPGVTITVADMSDSTRSTTFAIHVVDPKLRYTYVNITNPGFLAPSPWNNFSIPYLPFATMNIPNLADETGANTGMTLTLTDAWEAFGYSGMKRRNGSDLYPENVSYNSVYTTNTNNHRITLTGMDITKAYNIQFYTSHNTSQSTLTHFTINGDTVSLNGSENSNKTAQINGVVPDNTGTMVINCQMDAHASFGMLSALVIESYTPGVDTPFSPADLRVLDYSKSNTISLQWQDRASNETGYQVWRAADGGTYNLLATLPANSTTYVDSGLPNNTAYDYIVRAVSGSIYSVFSSPVRGYTYATTVFINLNNSTSPDPGAPFNSLNWVYRSLGVVWNNFNDDKGNKTNIGLSEPVNWDEVETNGDVTGNNSGIFPDNAIVQSWLNFVGDSSYLVLTGLDVSKTYDLVLFGSCTDDNTQNSTSIYQVNGKTSMLNAHLNNTGTVTMFGIQPDQNGNASIGVNAYDSSNSSYSMIGVIIIKGYTPSTNTISQPPVTSATGTTTLDATAARFADSASDASNPIAAYPNPFDESYTLQVPATMGDNVTVTMSDASGRTVYVKRFEGLFQGNNYLNIVPDETLTHGLYFVRVIYGSGTNNNAKVFKVLKK